jgi:hypothetical protein
VRHEVTSLEVYAKGVALCIHEAMNLSGLNVGMLSLMRED